MVPARQAPQGFDVGGLIGIGLQLVADGYGLRAPADSLWRRAPATRSGAARIAPANSCRRRERRGSLEGEPRRSGSPSAHYSMSKLWIVFSISSAAMSEVDWMPWILSLNSSGLLARRRASS